MGRGIIRISRDAFEDDRPLTLDAWHAFLQLPQNYHAVDLQAVGDDRIDWYILTVVSDEIHAVSGDVSPEVVPHYVRECVNARLERINILYPEEAMK